MITLHSDYSLKALNSFGFDITCSRFIGFDSAEDLLTVFRTVLKPGERFLVLGRGNNILFRENFDGTILHPAARHTEVVHSDTERVVVRAGAGLWWDDFVDHCVGNGLWGAENLAGIPGTVGAAPVQNIGAYGSEVKDIIESVTVFDTATCKTITLAGDHCGFGYRESIFKGELKGRLIITEVRFVLKREPEPKLGYGDLKERVERSAEITPAAIAQAVREIRAEKLPDPQVLGNAGSFFKNPVVDAVTAGKLKEMYPEMPVYNTEGGTNVKLSAGWLIDQCGLKGFREGEAGIHERQALVLVNYGGATGKEILALAGRVVLIVKEKFGVVLETEVNVI